MKKLLLALLLLFATPAFAQSSAEQVVPGTLSASGGSVHFVPLSTTNQLPIAVYDSGNHSGYCFTSNGSASPATFQVCSGGGGGSPGGSTNDIQYNAGSSTFGGITLTNGQLVVGQTSSTPLAKTVSGDTTLAASGAMTVAKVNGVAYAASPSTNTVPLITAANTATYTAVPDCQDSSGNHLNYNTTTHAFACGTSGGAAANLTVGTSVITSGSTTKVLFDNAGVLGEYTITGTGNVAMSASPTFTGTITAAAETLSGVLTTNVTGGGNQCLHASNTGVVTGTGSDCGSGAGGVTSWSGDGSLYTNSSSTGAVTATLGNQNANTIFAGPASGAATTPTFRSMVTADLPATDRADIALTLQQLANSSLMVPGESPHRVRQGPISIVSLGSNAFTVGQQGSINPILQVDSSTTGTQHGLKVKLDSTNNAVQLTPISSASDSSIELNPKGAGNIGIGSNPNANGSGYIQFTNSSSTTSVALSYSGGAMNSANSNTSAYFSVGQTNSGTTTASVERPIVSFGFNGGTQTKSSGTLTLQRDFLVQGAPDAFGGASTLTDAATQAIVLKNAGANATVTNTSGLLIQTKALTGTIGTSYGINVTAATGATNNYAARFSGGVQNDNAAKGNMSAVMASVIMANFGGL